jgi:hypothetical protein|nr:MAG TPA: hypothetical protein [Caudoviricetes sp.]
MLENGVFLGTLIIFHNDIKKCAHINDIHGDIWGKNGAKMGVKWGFLGCFLG